jgi:hypothetical protein
VIRGGTWYALERRPETIAEVTGALQRFLFYCLWIVVDEPSEDHRTDGEDSST